MNYEDMTTNEGQARDNFSPASNDPSKALFCLENLTKVFRSDNVETTALNNINIEIKHGEFVAVMGPSGCGKSTLLNIVGMLDNPTSGSFWFNGEDVAGYGENRLSAIRKQNIGFIFQSFNLIDELTVRENIELALLYHKVSAADRKERAYDVMERMEIAHRDEDAVFTCEATASDRKQKGDTMKVGRRTTPTDPCGKPRGRWSAPRQNVTTICAHSGKVCWLYRLSGLCR